MSAIEQEFGPPIHMTLDVYWQWRESQEQRFEWANGVVYAMTGAGRGHNDVVSNLFLMLATASRGTDCRVWASDMALFIEQSGKVFYPDLMVSCPPGADDRYETSPCLVVEVLSPSTQGRDRTIKLGEYSSIPGLKHYLMISSDRDEQFVISHASHGDLWSHTVLGPEEQITLSCPEITFRVGDLYKV